jgi:hypothetical protein
VSWPRQPHEALGATFPAQHFLNFLPLPQGQGSFRPIFGAARVTVRLGAAGADHPSEGRAEAGAVPRRNGRSRLPTRASSRRRRRDGRSRGRRRSCAMPAGMSASRRYFRAKSLGLMNVEMSELGVRGSARRRVRSALVHLRALGATPLQCSHTPPTTR